MSQIIDYEVLVHHLPVGTKVKCIGDRTNGGYMYGVGNVFTVRMVDGWNRPCIGHSDNDTLNGFDGRWEVIYGGQGLPLFDWANK
jgi:hypothetical protein